MDLGTEHLRLEQRGVVAWCTIERPEARNALTPAMYRGIGEAIAITTDDPVLGALVITGVGDVFAAGGDMNIDEDAGQARNAPSLTLPFSALRHARVPIVVAVNGICQASGLLLALLSDVAIASDRASFRAPELLRGYSDMWFAAVLPAHVGAGRARELVMTGRKVDAAEALAIGLVERVVPHAELDDRAHETALALLESAPGARAAFKRAVNAGYGVVDELTMDTMPSSPEVAEGFRAFLAKRPPSWSPRA